MNSKREENSQVSTSRPSNDSAVAESEKLHAFEDDKNQSVLRTLQQTHLTLSLYSFKLHVLKFEKR